MMVYMNLSKRIMKTIYEEFKGHKWVYIILCGAVIISAFLRLWGLGNTPFVADEFLDVNATYGYHKIGEWQAWDFNHDAPSIRDNEASDERAWLYRLQVAELYNYLEPTEFTVRLVSVLWGILTTLVIYFVAYSFTKNRWIALVAAFLWAVSVPAIEINRKIRMYSMFAPVFLLFMWSIFQFVESRVNRFHEDFSKKGQTLVSAILVVQWMYIVPVVFFGAIAMHLHVLTGNFIIVVVIYLLLMIYFGGGGVMRKRYLFYLGVIGVNMILVRVMRPTDWAYFSQTVVFFENHWSYVGHILRNYWHPLVGGIMMIVGAWYLIKKQKDPRAGIWVTSVFFGLLFMAMFVWLRNVGAQYIFFAQPFGLILAAAGVVCIAEYISSVVSQHKKIYIGVIISGCIFLPNYGYFMEENNTYHITAEAETANYRKVFDYVKRNYVEGEVLITRNFRNYYWSGLDVQVFDFGSERAEEQLMQEGKVKRITRAYVEEIVQNHPAGWVVIAENDENFVEKEAQDYFEENFTRVKGSSLLNGDVRVYRWGTNQ